MIRLDPSDPLFSHLTASCFLFRFVLNLQHLLTNFHLMIPYLFLLSFPLLVAGFADLFSAKKSVIDELLFYSLLMSALAFGIQLV